MEVRSVVVKSLHTWAWSPSYFAALLQTPYFCYSKEHVVGVLQHFELERPSNCEINRWVSRWRVHERCCSLRSSQTSSPWNGLFVRRVVHFRDVICARRYYQTGQCKMQTADRVQNADYIVGTKMQTADWVQNADWQEKLFFRQKRVNIRFYNYNLPFMTPLSSYHLTISRILRPGKLAFYLETCTVNEVKKDSFTSFFTSSVRSLYYK